MVHAGGRKEKKGRDDVSSLITRQRARFTIRLFLPLQCLTSVFGMGTGMTTALSSPDLSELLPWKLNNFSDSFYKSFLLVGVLAWINLRPISISQLNTSLCLHPWPIYLVVFKGSYPFYMMGNLILESVSHLDAFSAYPVRSQLSSCATGVTTGAP